MLSTEAKAARHEKRCAAMRERSKEFAKMVRLAKRRKYLREWKQRKRAAQAAEREASRRVRAAEILAEQAKENKELRRREHNSFARMGTYLARQARELAEERYVTAVYGIPTSWAAVERAGIYGVWRRRKGVLTRECTSVRPDKLWLNSPLPPLTAIDRHHVARHTVSSVPEAA